jgi:tetrapyrrole methylase family protein/MazG family protein
MGDEVGARFERVVELMGRLRGDGGCPWDREQTRDSLRPYLIEEAYEVLEALGAGDPPALCEELGDLLLQVVFHAQIAAEQGEFDIADVLAALAEKLIRRHPHVFGDVVARTSQQVLFNWERIKHQERRRATPAPSALDGVPAALPALLRAARVQEKARRAGLEWPGAPEPAGGVEAAWTKLREAAGGATADRARAERDLGELLFALVGLAQALGLDPEEALRSATGRFADRFRSLEGALGAALHPPWPAARS